MTLTGDQKQQLHGALLSAFPNKTVLSQLVAFKLNENLEAIAQGDSLSDLVFQLIIWAQRQGRLDTLISGALDANPGNPALQDFIRDLASASPDSPSAKGIDELQVIHRNVLIAMTLQDLQFQQAELQVYLMNNPATSEALVLQKDIDRAIVRQTMQSNARVKQRAKPRSVGLRSQWRWLAMWLGLALGLALAAWRLLQGS